VNEPVILIKNQSRWKGPGTYVGRPAGLGNPFQIGRDGGRAEVIAKYRVWLEERMNSRNPASLMFVGLFDELCEKNELILVCWCSPKSCHAEVIKDLLLQAWREKYANPA
jgi:hypothetical protein